MNFIFQNQLEALDLNKEVVIITNINNEKKILLNFPTYRFSNFQNKYLKFLKEINGEEEVNKENNCKYIISSEDDYSIYSKFCFIFY